MNYLSKPIAGLLTKTSQLFLGRVTIKLSFSSGRTVQLSPTERKALPVGSHLKKLCLKMNYHLKSAYLNPSKENVTVLIDYLTRTGGKELKLTCRRQNTFKTTWTSREVNLTCRCHVQNAAEYLSSILTDFKDGQIKVVIADIVKYIKALDEIEDVSFILLSTNTLPSAIHFDAAKKLFYTHQIREQNQNNYNTDLLTIYSLRLALESRIRKLLGVDYATNKGKSIGLTTLIKVSKDLKSVTYSNDFNWTEIEWVNDWLNHHMHRHIRPYPWVIFQALETLKPFVDPKEPIFVNEKKIYSFYSATYVHNEEEFEQELETALKQEYPDIEITWLTKREIVKP